MAGWFKIQRDIQEHWLWEDREPFDKRSAWIDLIMLANFEDFKTVRNNHVVERKRGEVNTSSRYLASRWGWSRNKVSRFLHLLNEDGMVSISGTADGTTITIENYNKYQDSTTTDEASNGATVEAKGEPPTEPPASHPRTTHGANDKKSKEIIKKSKEVIKNNYYPIPAKFESDYDYEFDHMTPAEREAWLNEEI